MKKLVTFGEAMIRLTTPVGVPLEAATGFSAPVGGAELNVAIAARRQGAEAVWVSTLPAGPLGDVVARHAAANGVTAILRRPPHGRVGLYFLEQALPPRASRIVYDRADTAFVRWPEPEQDWNLLLDGATCLVVSGITAALGPEARKAAETAIHAARAGGLTVAVDINYRASLWSLEEAFAWLASIVDQVDVLAASHGDLTRLGVSGSDEEIHRKAVDTLGLSAAIGSSKDLDGRLARVHLRAATREATAACRVEAQILDPVGAGDAMFGTFLALLDRGPLQQAVDTAAGAMVTAYGLEGDALVADPWNPQEHGGVKR